MLFWQLADPPRKARQRLLRSLRQLPEQYRPNREPRGGAREGLTPVGEHANESTRGHVGLQRRPRTGKPARSQPVLPAEVEASG